ncbi:alanine--tRNA ligase [Candidatus Methylomirabilis limnetica]|uniref:Alanine--tRNA ligase n=1 Tax=Candidatus Methylomirabilis limnetica TaxID=2033718 RepID=A0A2T4U048_9BACT|nr:alanine--tRNA ligase [Candidatus Methylomirabilis limnetica]
MLGLTGGEIRERFLRFFERNDHTVVASSSLVPADDPTLLFTNAGMVPFKGVFLGTDPRPYRRAASIQKCLRVSGKHNDLENVGRTARHHTFFEMLGNFSFGDYFKESAIEYGWAFLTRELKLPADRLWATIYKDDDEAFNLWQRLAGLPPDRVVRLGDKDNFWTMGETGPCGPCSELIFDQGPMVGCGRTTCSIECGCDRYLELWNLVFMQYNRDASGTLTPLPKPSIDTGAGLERMAAVCQGVTSNFETDLIRPLIATVEELSQKRYGADEKDDVSMRVIADHARAVTFALADGVLPGNEGRGYVLRRILRRALRHGRLLGLDKPFLAAATDKVIDLMTDAYPDLPASRAHVARFAWIEEDRFSIVLREALPRLHDLIQNVKTQAAERAMLPGSTLFELYDTFGVPRDLMDEIATEQSVECDWGGFEVELRRQREQSRSHLKAFGDVQGVAEAFRDLAKTGRTVFLGYECLDLQASVVAVLADGKQVDRIDVGQEGDVVLDQTPFYAESGGQVGDTGYLRGEALIAEVLDTKRPLTGLIVHRVRVKRGDIRRGQRLTASVDACRRDTTVKNHTATHLVHAALRQILGDHVRQEGSLVAPDRLRFDFRHYGPLSPAEITQIEEIVNTRLWANQPVVIEEMRMDEALAKGALAFFGDKYGDEVRVVSIADFSIELCGGAHTKATGEIGLFKISHETGVAAGVRRIEALTGPGAFQHLKREGEVLQESADRLKSKPLEVPEKVDRLFDATRALEREVQQLRAKLGAEMAEELLKKATQVSGVTVVTGLAEWCDQRALRELADRLRAKISSGVIVLATSSDGRVSWVAAVTPDLTSRLHAGKLVKEVASITGGSGGGRADLAEAGGKDPDKLNLALQLIPDLVRRFLA